MASTCWLLCVLVAYGIQNSEGACKDADSLTEMEKLILEAHNSLRSRHQDTQLLCYGESGEDIEFRAQAWADDLAERKLRVADRSTKNFTKVQYGELLHSGGKKGALKDDMFYVNRTIQQTWYGGINNWNFTDGFIKNSKRTNSNFAQIVWNNTRQVTCGFATYSKDKFNGYHVVCQYFPSGLYSGEGKANVFPLKEDKEPATEQIKPEEKPEEKPGDKNPEYVIEPEETEDPTDSASGHNKILCVVSVTIMMLFRGLV